MKKKKMKGKVRDSREIREKEGMHAGLFTVSVADVFGICTISTGVPITT
jgi:hypothetical protein